MLFVAFDDQLNPGVLPISVVAANDSPSVSGNTFSKSILRITYLISSGSPAAGVSQGAFSELLIP